MNKFRLVVFGFTAGIIITAFACGINTKNLIMSMGFLLVAIIVDCIADEKDRAREE